MAMTEAQMRALARQSAQAEGIDPVWFEAQLMQESRYNPNAVSHAKARGVAQFMPGTAKDFGIDPTKPEQAIPAAAKYMAQLKKRYGGNEEHARLAYNWGMGNVDAYLKTGKGAKGQPLPKEAAEYNTMVASHIPGGSKPAGAQQAAKAPGGDMAMALQEVDMGLPPMTLLGQESAPGGDWMGYLQELTNRPPAMSAPLDGMDALAQLQSQAAADQDRLLANALGGIKMPELPGAGSIPAAVDRYLDRLLAT